MRKGGPTTAVDLEDFRLRLHQGLARLPDYFRTPEPSPASYPVSFSQRLNRDLDTVQADLIATS
jgi:hypothetical protein